MTATIADPGRLADEACRILVADLEGHGNSLSAPHRAALRALVQVFTDYCTGKQSGRLAVPLPTGMGKTSAVVAFLAALHLLGYRVPVSVAASKVEALCGLKRDLQAHGVPEEWIGLKHSHRDASEPSTGDDSRVFQLVTHARIRGGSDFDLFGMHEGQPRALCVYDETLMRSDAFAFSIAAFRSAVSVLRTQCEEKPDPGLRELLDCMETADRGIRQVRDGLRSDGDPHSNGRPLVLAEHSPAALETFRATLGRLAGPLRGFDDELLMLLDQSQGTLRIVTSAQGDGVVTAREVVPLELRDVVVLDASTAVRELVALDPTIRRWTDFDGETLKDFSALTINQVVSPGGRSTFTHTLSAKLGEASAAAREVATIIRDGWATERAFLVFTFNKRGSIDPQAMLRNQLRALGVDIEAKTCDGRSRIEWLTWGQETSLNGMEHCTSVIMAGVLHRSHLDLSAQARGQVGHLADSVPNETIRRLVESEIAHAIYQGASRGSCRRVSDGKAQAMRLWFIHRDPGIRRLLDRVMPGATWNHLDPTHLKKALADTKAGQLLGRLLGHLDALPQGVEKVSSREVKAALGLEKTTATEQAFTRAVRLLDPDAHGWKSEGRSLIRVLDDYGLDDRAT